MCVCLCVSGEEAPAEIGGVGGGRGGVTRKMGGVLKTEPVIETLGHSAAGNQTHTLTHTNTHTSSLLPPSLKGQMEADTHWIYGSSGGLMFNVMAAEDKREEGKRMVT